MATQSLSTFVDQPAIKKRFEELLGKNAAAYTSTLITVWNGSEQLQRCEPRSIVAAAALSATLGLPINPSLGQAYIVPRGNKAVFQIGVKGMIQLAHRTGQYIALHAGKVYEGEIADYDPITGEYKRGARTSHEVSGYIAYMKLKNGMEKTIYMSVAEIEAHALRFSQSYEYDKRTGKKSSPWSTNFDAMAEKTVLKRLLTKWGILSMNLASALDADQREVDEPNQDALDADDIQIDSETGEIIAEA